MMTKPVDHRAGLQVRIRPRRIGTVAMVAMMMGVSVGASPPAAAASLPPGEAILVIARRPHAFGAQVPNEVLETLRGGVQLPNGMNISIGIDIQTRVDGLLVLHTLYATDGPDAGIRVFTDGAAPSPAPTGAIVVRTEGSEGAAEVTVSRAPTGTTIDISTPSAPAKVNIVSGLPSTWEMAAGQTQVPVTENGPAVVTPAGAIRLATDERGGVVTLDAPALQLRHIVGEAAGIIVANAGNDRTIDTISSVNLDLQGFSPALMAGLSMGDQLALAVASAR